MEYIAHIADNGHIQTVKNHNENVAILAGEMAVNELHSICVESGRGHDAGKYQHSFQERIRGKDIQVEHSICGAQAAIEKYGNNPLGMMIALCIAGHHGGIPDCGTVADKSQMSTLKGRLKREMEDFSKFNEETPFKDIDPNELISLITKYCKNNDEMVECFAFLTRYCYSCLVDADTIDTINAMGRNVPSPLIADFDDCERKVDAKLAELKNCADLTDVQRARSRIQAQAFSNISQCADIYLMGTPTGSGKTIASLKCALERVRLTNNKKRIIYIIPYNSIIDQTARDFDELLGESAQILRHQSSFSYENAEDIDEDYRQSLMFSCENWDAQVIITTAVQFFESVYSNRRRKLKKLHNIADSVLVFDEAHLMPTTYLQACLRAVVFATKYLHSEAIFLTATMPNFDELIKKYALKESVVQDIVPDKSDFRFFKKNTYIQLGHISDEELISKAMSYPSSLIVVNSRRAAKRIYNKCGGKKYHLSTWMTYLDRDRVISEVKCELKRLAEDYPDMENVPPERRIVLVSTSLIEAGVNLDFYTAFRELRGLDNILQTGGRCNREGKFANGNVYVFELDDDRTLSEEQYLAKSIMREFSDITDSEAISEYFRRLFERKEKEITEHSLSAECKRYDQIKFRTYSENMRIIDSETLSLIIPQDDKCMRIVETAKHTGEFDARKVQDYCCSIHPNEMDTLIKMGVVDNIGGIYVLNNMGFYNNNTGIKFEGEALFV